MVFMTLKTVVFQNEKTRFSFEILFLILSVCNLVLLFTGQKYIIVVMRMCQKPIVFKELVMILLVSSPVFQSLPLVFLWKNRQTHLIISLCN